jgi:hypothetical protein
MSAIQIVCAVAVPFALGLSIRGHQSGRYGVSASLLPRTALPGHRAAAYSVRQKAQHVNSSALSQLFRFSLVD